MDTHAQDQRATAEVDRAVMDALTGPHATPLWTLMDRAPVGVFVLDSGGDCAYVNERASDLAGLSPEACLGDGIFRALHPEDRGRVHSAWQAAAIRGEGWSMGFRLRSPSGVVRFIDGAGSAIHDAGGSLVGWLTIAVDLTESRRTQERLESERGERAALLVRMLHAAEHERMLMAIELHDGPIQHLASFGYTLDRVSRKLLSGDVQAGSELLHGVRSGLTREVETLRRLMAELRPPVLDERGLEAALGEYAADFEERDPHPVHFPQQPRAAEVRRRRRDGPLSRHAGGTRERSQARRGPGYPHPARRARGSRRAHHLRRRRRVRSRRLRRRRPRRALRTAQPARARRRCGRPRTCPLECALRHPRRGHRAAEPRRRHRTALAGRDVGGVASASLAPPTVVVVDDQETVRRVLVALLKDDGFDVIAEGADGAEAVRLADELQPELVLMDIRMPVMSGRVAAGKIAARWPATRIVLLSGSDDPETLVPSPDDGVFDMVPKSGDAGRLCQALRRALEDGRRQEGGR